MASAHQRAGNYWSEQVRSEPAAAARGRIESFQPVLGKPLTWALAYYFAKH